MSREEATALVDAWVKEWRLYLDGGIHKKPREALIAAIEKATAPAEDVRKRKGRAAGVAADEASGG